MPQKAKPPFIHFLNCPIGLLSLHFSEHGLIKIGLDSRSKKQRISLSSLQASPNFEKAKLALKHFFSNKPYSVDFLDWSICTAFQKKVLTKLMSLPSGKTSTYKELATATCGSPNFSRAVGTCMRLNPWPLLVPCHRIIPTSGGLGQYSLGGPDIKAKLLQMENLTSIHSELT